MRSAVLLKAADDRVLRPASLDIAGAEEGQQETLVGTGFSVLASQTAQGFGFFIWIKCFQRVSLV